MDKIKVPAQQLPLLTGVVRMFNAAKGFGLITPDTGGPDLFMQASQVHANAKKLKVSQHVSYELGQGAEGPVATNVRIA